MATRKSKKTPLKSKKKSVKPGSLKKRAPKKTVSSKAKSPVKKSKTKKISDSAAHALKDKELKEAYLKLRKAHEEIKEAHMAIVLKLAIVAEYRDADTGAHIIRISDYGCELAKAIGLSEQEIENYRFASPMHDIGKIAIPDSILKKEGRLTESEFEVMKTHAEIGSKMFSGSNSPIMIAAADICKSHHEKWDGSGYPSGIKGEQIPLFGRILAIVDVFDALSTKRCYKDAWSFDDAVDYIKKQSGSHFDPALVRAFLKALPKIRHIYDSNIMIQNVLAGLDELDVHKDFENR
ncbi:MAG: HD domain-containing protein [Candidatus Omnitrophica bacterium]|nr:HD domain-containing protein [Candidatus Omnitrophota bacterium]